MCEIQFIKKLNTKLNKKDKGEFIDMMKKGAVSNGDAYGIFSRNYIIKEGVSFKAKISNINRDSGEFKSLDTDFLVGHNRFTTQGNAKNNHNNHPFESEGFIIVHNGVIHNDDTLKQMYNLDYKEEVDSAIVVYLLEHLVKEHKENIIDAVNIVAESLEGSFSIMIYSKVEDCLYYFKNNNTSFYFARILDDNGITILGSTNETSLEESYIDYDMIFPIERFKDKVIIEASDEVVYKIDNYRIKEVNTFVAKKSWGGSYSGYSNYSGYSPSYDITDWEDEYPQINDFLEVLREDILSNYKLNSYQTDYKAGTLWFRCDDEDLIEKIREKYPEIRETKKGIIFDFEDIWDTFSIIYNVSKPSKEEKGYTSIETI
jgi:hypothetical protein